MSISSLTKLHIKLPLYLVNQALRRDFRGARAGIGLIATKAKRQAKKGHCTRFGETVILRAIGNCRDRSVPVPVDQFH